MIIGGDFSKEALESQHDNVKLINIVGSEMKSLIKQAKWVIASGGYSTMMDMKILQKQAILIPMTGQPEQQYLALYLSEDPDFKFVQMDDLEQLELKNIYFEKSRSSSINDKSQKEIAIQMFMDLLGS